MKTQKILGFSLMALLSFATFLEAGKIGPSGGLVDQVSPSHSKLSFGGWNLDNVNVKMTDLDYNTSALTTFDEATGSYDASMGVGDTFESDIHETTTGNESTVLVNLHGKDWPVGEPAGIKVLEGSATGINTNGTPTSCIMTTSYLEGSYLDSTTPSETLCDSEFQSHKRFKLNLLPSMDNSGHESEAYYGNGVNLTFNVEDSPDENWRYMVLQKINNYTDKRLDGYKMEIGFLDEGGVFTKVSLTPAAGELKLSIGTAEDTNKDPATDVWDSSDLATFSNGLFGAIDDNFDTNGFFDNTRAGFNVSLIDGDTIESGAVLGSNYTTLFGNWLPSIWAPSGIFWDDDNDPLTDATLMAFWADYDNDNTYEWTKGNEDNFVKATADELTEWASSSAYQLDIVEDVLNLGLNYIVQVGDITSFPTTSGTTGTFTIRVTPHFAPVAEQVEPGYITTEVLSDYITGEGAIAIRPAPSFDIGNPLTIDVADVDLSGTATVSVEITTSLGESETIILNELDSNRGVFTLALPTVSGSLSGTDNDGSIIVTDGTIVTAKYSDVSNGSSVPADVTATTTAGIVPVTTPEVTTTTDDGGSSGAVNDNISLLFTIFGFLFIGGLIVRRKLA